MDRIVEVGDRQDRGRGGHALARRHERCLEQPRVRAESHDDDVIGAGHLAEILHDRLDDRVRRDGSGQPLEDPGEALHLAATADLERLDRLAVNDCRGRRHPHQHHDEDVKDARSAGRGVDEGDHPEDDERAGEEPPRPPDARFLRVGRVRCG
jgi:hypothetical protein